MRLGSNKGYTLAEIIVVLGIIGALLAIGMPAMTSQMSHLRLTRSVRDVSTALQAARMKAIAKNMRYRAEFTLNTAPAVDTFALAYYQAGAWVADTSSAPREVAQGIDITSPASSFQVEFYPNGTATAQTICLQNTAADRMKVTVEMAMGRVSVENGC